MALLWMVYGLPSISPCRLAVLVSNSIGVALQLLYLIIFVVFADSKRRRTIAAGAVAALAISAAVIGIALGFEAQRRGAAALWQQYY